jgi:hypothetical protein
MQNKPGVSGLFFAFGKIEVYEISMGRERGKLHLVIDRAGLPLPNFCFEQIV